MKGRLSYRIKEVMLTAMGLLSASLIAAFTLCDQMLFPLPIERLSRPPAHYLYSAEGEPLGRYTSSDTFWRLPVKLEEISPQLINSVIECEDKWFYYHLGINPISLVNAAVDNLKAGRVVRGASTITMQIARMIEPKERTVVSKIFEMFRALQLELRYTKDELLEIYFNLAPYGGNIEGVGAASLHYFNHSIGELTISEAAILTAIPASPNRYRPDRHPEALIERRNQVLKRLLSAKAISEDQYTDALSEQIPHYRSQYIQLAPHLSQEIISQFPNQAQHHTTINYRMQLLAERLALEHHLSLIERDIHNLAVVIIENKTGKIKALVGSPSFADNQHGGQVNAAFAPRSPGSTLKPFVYALAFESGEITPSSLVEDVPVNFSGYRPENYDEQYHGVVTAADALIRSLNVPAVNITARIGLTNLYDLLVRGGVTTLRSSAGEHGLPLILGGCELSLLGLTALYSSLAREGTYIRPIMLEQNTNADRAKDQRIENQSRRILSRESCFLVSKILVDLERPTLSSSWEHAANIPHVAWKTGTSYGRRDAWSVGYSPQFTVGVWVGNVSGSGSPDLVGAEVAAPLLFSLFQEISEDNTNSWLKRPTGVGEREVCALSGELANGVCPALRRADYIKDVSSLRHCKIHREILVDRITGKLLCRACSSNNHAEEKVVEFWPSRLNSWLISQGGAAPLPEHDPNCSGQLSDQGPVVSSPESFGVYKIRTDAPLEYQQILLAASVAPDCSQIHWFIDNNLLMTSKPSERVFYQPKSGKHSVMCVDDQGRSATVDFTVE